MEGFMEPTQNRTPERWNSVLVPPEVAERAWRKVRFTETGCWESTYSVGSHGYAQIGWQVAPKKNHMVLAHRAAWTRDNGQVPLGMTIDHLCKNRRCVRPAHLRLLPNFENARRINGQDWPIGSCRNGHPAAALIQITRRAHNGEVRKGRTCGECMRQSSKDWVTRNPAKRKEAVRRYNAKRNGATA